VTGVVLSGKGEVEEDGPRDQDHHADEEEQGDELSAP
jgi:hypothetical protein